MKFMIEQTGEQFRTIKACDRQVAALVQTHDWVDVSVWEQHPCDGSWSWEPFRRFNKNHLKGATA